MKVLDRYILKEFCYSLAGVLFMCIIVLLVHMLIENYEDILKNNPGLRYTTLYFLNSLPFRLLEVVPLAVAIAVLYTVGGFARHNELVAMVAAGISLRRIALPILMSALVICFLTLLLNEMVVPGCQERALYIEKVYIEGKGKKIITRSREIFVKGKGQRFYVMKAFDSSTNIMTRPTIIDINPSGSSLVMRMDADRAELIGKELGGRFWRFENARRWSYDASGRLVKFEKFARPITLTMEEDLEKFLSSRKEPEEMNFIDLRNYIRILANRGEPVAYYQTDLQLKLAFPFASLIVALLCFRFAVRLESRNLVMSYALGIVCAIGYYALTAFSQAMGHHLIFPSIMAGWLANVSFATLGAFFLHQL